MTDRLSDFRLEGLYGTGGMGRVFRARHVQTGVPAALKVLETTDGLLDPGLEAAALARLHHPNILWIYDHGQATDALPDWGIAAGAHWIALETASGGDLMSQPVRSWRGLRSILVTLLDALAHAHGAGVLHRDLKITNVLRSTEDDLRPGWKLADFGIAQLGTHTELAAGTPAYIPPEQTAGDALGPQSDLYAFGVMMWRLTVGDYPFRKEKRVLRKLREELEPFDPLFDVPPAFEDWIRLLLRAHPDERPQTCADALSVLPSGDRRSRPRPFATRPIASLEDDKTAPSGAAVTGLFGRPSRPAPPPAPLPDQRPPTGVPAPPEVGGTGVRLVALRRPPLVARQAERDHLWASVVQAEVSKEPTHIAVYGPRGFGHTALGLSLVHDVRQHSGAGATYLHVGDAPAEALLRAALRLPEQAPLDQVRSTLEERGLLFGRIAHGLDRLATGERAIAPSTALSVLSALARDRTQVVVVDGACDALTDLLGNLRGPIAWVSVGNRTCPSDVHGVELSPLTLRARRSLLTSLLPMEVAAANQLADAFERPVDLRRCVVQALQQGKLHPGPKGRFVLTGRPRFSGRSLSLSQFHRAILAGIAHHPGSPSTPQVETALGVSPRMLSGLRVTGERGGWLTLHGERWFLDPEVRVWAREQQPREPLLERWAEALSTSDPHLAVGCWLELGRPLEAVRTFKTLPERAGRKGDEIALVTACLEAVRHLPLEPEVHGFLWLKEVVHSPGTVREIALTRAQQATELGWNDVAATSLLHAAVNGGPDPNLRSWLERGVSMASPSYARGRLYTMLVETFADDPLHDTWLANARADMTLDGSPRAEAILSVLDTRLAMRNGDLESALRASRVTTALARQGHASLLNQLGNTAHLLMALERWPEAKKMLAEAQELASLSLVPREIALITVNRAELGFRCDDPDLLEQQVVILEGCPPATPLAWLAVPFRLLLAAREGDPATVDRMVTALQIRLEQHAAWPELVDELLQEAAMRCAGARSQRIRRLLAR
jgi:hypothetical protein